MLLPLRGERDERAWAEFLLLYEPLVLRLMRRRGLQESDARDTTQQVLLRISGAIERYQPDGAEASFRRWLFRVARNVVVTFVTKQSLAAGSSRGCERRSKSLNQKHEAEGREPLAVSRAPFPFPMIESSRSRKRMTANGHRPDTNMNRITIHVDRDELQRLLEDAVPEPRATQVAEHVAECSECRQQLESLAGQPQWWSQACSGVQAILDDPARLGRLGEYEIVQVIGRSGMGVVLKGFQKELNRYVVVKVLAPHLAMSGAARRRMMRR